MILLLRYFLVEAITKAFQIRRRATFWP